MSEDDLRAHIERANEELAARRIDNLKRFRDDIESQARSRGYELSEVFPEIKRPRRRAVQKRAPKPSAPDFRPPIGSDPSDG